MNKVELLWNGHDEIPLVIYNDADTNEWRKNRPRSTKCLSWEDTHLGTPGATLHAVKCFCGANFNNVVRDTTKAAPLPVPERFDTDVYSFLSFHSTLFLPVHVSTSILLYTCLSSSIITIGTTNTTKQPPIIYSIFFRFFAFSFPPEYAPPSCTNIYRLYLDSRQRFYKRQ